MASSHRFGLQQVYPPVDSEDETTIESVFDVGGNVLSAHETTASLPSMDSIHRRRRHGSIDTTRVMVGG
jgi:hypothetical protein